MTTETITIRRCSRGYRRADRGYNKGIVHALVGPHTVTLVERRGWLCSCPDDRCGHIDTVAGLIDPETLDAIENGRSRGVQR